MRLVARSSNATPGTHSPVLREAFQFSSIIAATRMIFSVASRKTQITPSQYDFPPGILANMNRQRGYTLIETLIVISLVLILSASGLYGWQSWQQSQRLWQTASAVRDYLLYLRNDANWHNIDRRLRVNRTAQYWCLVADDTVLTDCPSGNPAVFRPLWAQVSLSKMTPNLTFFGVRNTAWAGSIVLSNAADSWSIVISSWGRVRLCEAATC